MKRNPPLDVEIIYKGQVTPSAPTPCHLRNYEVSVLDQITIGNVYNPIVFFYPNYGPNTSEITLERRQVLKHSLSQTLTRFYPLAGKVKDQGHIDCNDEGVYYAEAKVNDHLSHFLAQPDHKSIHRLLPFIPFSPELLSQTEVILIQINIFVCGGIAIGLYTSHKICDGYSTFEFFKAWGASARGCLDEIRPDFTTSPSIFLPILALQNIKAPLNLLEQTGNYSTRRFVFSSSSTQTLMEKSGPSSSRVSAVTSFLWKCAMSSSKKASKPYILRFPVNLRGRSSPSFPPYCIGNITWCASVHCERDENAELSTLVGKLRSAIGEIDSGFIEKMKGKEGAGYMGELLMGLKSNASKDSERMAVTSLCNGGVYESDFGWGKPIWVCIGDPDFGVPVIKNGVYLMDTRLGGIEAWVTLSEDQMAIFERDHQLLTFASVNPSPLLQSQILFSKL